MPDRRFRLGLDTKRTSAVLRSFFFDCCSSPLPWVASNKTNIERFGGFLPRPDIALKTTGQTRTRCDLP